MRPIDEILEALSTAPDTQIDHTITPRLKALVGQSYSDIEPALKQILDECAFASLASDFAMMAMDQVWQMSKEQ